MPGTVELAPARKANPSVKEVIVMEGPACLIQAMSRSLFDNFNEL